MLVTGSHSVDILLIDIMDFTRFKLTGKLEMHFTEIQNFSIALVNLLITIKCITVFGVKPEMVYSWFYQQK